MESFQAVGTFPRPGYFLTALCLQQLTEVATIVTSRKPVVSFCLQSLVHSERRKSVGVVRVLFDRLR